MHILLVEDDGELGAAIQTSLLQQHWTVAWVGTVQEALDRVRLDTFDLIVLDLNLPDGHGLSVLQALRQQAHRASHTAVLIASARDTVAERVHGLDEGADDYLVKPFALAELHARVRSVMRRSQMLSSGTLSWDHLSLDVASREVRSGALVLTLSQREAAVLEMLLLQAGRPVEKDKLLEHLKARVGALDAPEARDEISINALEVYVHRLRKKLEPLQVTVRTLRGIGYSLTRSRPA